MALDKKFINFERETPELIPTTTSDKLTDAMLSDTVTYPAPSDFTLDPDTLNPDERTEQLRSTIELINEKLEIGNVHQLLGQVPPLILNKLFSSKLVSTVDPVKLLWVASYCSRYKYISSLIKTPAEEVFMQLIDGGLSKLTPDQIAALASTLDGLKFNKEDSWRKMSIYIMENQDSFSARNLANIMTSFVHTARKSSSFTGFYEFMKVRLTELILAQKLDSKDLMGIVRSYSKTYNLTKAFIEVLEEAILTLFDKKKLQPKEMTIICHSLSLNHRTQDCPRLWACLRQYFDNYHNSLSLSEFMLSLKALQKIDQFTKSDFKLLLNRIEYNTAEANLMDIHDIFKVFFFYAETNPDSCLSTAKVDQGRKVLRDQYKPALHIMIQTLLTLSPNLEAGDVVFYLNYVDWILEEDSEEARKLLTKLRSSLRHFVHRNSFKPSEVMRAREAIKNISDEQTRRSFSSKLA